MKEEEDMMRMRMGGKLPEYRYGGAIDKYAVGGKFPDLTGDGKVTMADILKGRGVIK